MSELNAVGCAVPGDCWAVGDYGSNGIEYPLIEHLGLNGWAVVDAPPGGTSLRGVTCVSAGDCWAVGYSAVPSGLQPLIEHYDGTVWSVADSPTVGASIPDLTQSGGGVLDGVACAGADDCWAVGYTPSNGTYAEPLIERSSGGAWAVTSSPKPLGSVQTILTSVSCLSDGNCTAVGYDFVGGLYQTLVEGTSGGSWTLSTSPNVTASVLNELLSVQCTSDGNCMAAGYFNNNGTYQTLMEEEAGGTWSIVTTPNPTNAGYSAFLGVACGGGGPCWAVGSSDGKTSGSSYLTTIEQRSPTGWMLTDSPNATGATYNNLAAVTCTSDSVCWAVGSALVGGTYVTLIEEGSAPAA